MPIDLHVLGSDWFGQRDDLFVLPELGHGRVGVVRVLSLLLLLFHADVQHAVVVDLHVHVGDWK